MIGRTMIARILNHPTISAAAIILCFSACLFLMAWSYEAHYVTPQ